VSGKSRRRPSGVYAKIPEVNY